MKAAVKWTRQTEKRSKRNLDVKSRLKTLFKKAAASKDAAAGRDVESQFDKAAAKGIVHRNKAARKKSRMAKALASAPVAAVKATKGKSKAKGTAAKSAAKKKSPK